MATPDRNAADREATRRTVEESGGKLLAAAFEFLAEPLPVAGQAEEGKTSGAIQKSADEQSGARIRAALDSCIAKDESGRRRFSVVLPDDAALEKFTAAIAGAPNF